jgi:hypothetical protein
MCIRDSANNFTRASERTVGRMIRFAGLRESVAVG